MQKSKLMERKKMSNKTDKSVRFYYTDNTHSRFIDTESFALGGRQVVYLWLPSLNLGQTLLIFHDLVNTNPNF